MTLLHVRWNGEQSIGVCHHTNYTTSAFNLHCHPVSDNELATAQRHTNNRGGSCDFPPARGRHYVTSTCNYSTVLWSHHITSALWSTSRPRHQSPRLAYLFPACDSWFHITPVRPRALIWWFRSRISVTHWIRAQGRSEIVRGLSPDDRPLWKYVRLSGRWVLGNERTSCLDVLVETETWNRHLPHPKFKKLEFSEIWKVIVRSPSDSILN